MKLLTASQMRQLDRYAIDVLGIPSTLLMTNAAAHVAQTALSLLDDGAPVVVFCGTGNNGGDGIAAAAYLLRHRVTVRVFLVGSRDKMTPDAREMVRRLDELGGTLEDFSDGSEAEYAANNCGLIIDALFGVGLNAPIRGDALDAVRLINASAARVVSADIPSGVDADTGLILGDAVRADVTVTFSSAKPGLVSDPGSVCAGDVRVVDIGLPADIIADTKSDSYAVTDGDIILPRRRRDAHKGDFGRVVIVAGAVGYTGAPVLSARAASAAGAGLVALGVPESIYQIAAVKCDEEMVFPLPASPLGLLGQDAADAVLMRLETADVCLVGPGLGRSDGVTAVVEAVIKNAAIPVILDADGINALSGNIDILDEAACPLILTPHPGEFRRLGGDTSGGRIEGARQFAVRRQCVLVLKGHRTVTALPDGSVYLNTTGGPALAKGGTGDVLAGIITALVGQKFPIKDAVLAAVYLHGLSGDRCAEALGDYSVTASDVIAGLPEAFKSVIDP